MLGDQPGADLGPLISPEAKQRVCDLVQSGVDEGANVRGQDLLVNMTYCLFVCMCLCVHMHTHMCIFVYCMMIHTHV